jgi:hypothetical protein
MVGTRHKIYDKGRLYDINMSFYLEKNQLSEFKKLKHMKIIFLLFFLFVGGKIQFKNRLKMQSKIEF